MSRRPLLRCLAVAVALGLPLSAAAQAVQEGASELTLEEQRALEEALGQDAAASEPEPAPSPRGGIRAALGSMNPDLSLVTDLAAAWFSDPEPLEGGAHDPVGTGFTLQQLELSLGQAVDPYFRFDAYLVFSQFGVEVEEAYATTLALPGRLQLRAGQFLTRFGRINSVHPHAWLFVDQPLAMTRVFGGEANRGLGGELSWLSPLPWYLELLGSVTDARGAATARSFLGGGQHEVTSPLDFQLTSAVKQFFELSEDLSLLWGLSAANGPSAQGNRSRTDVWGTDLYLKHRSISAGGDATELSLQLELLYRRRQVPDDLLQDLSGYAQLFWRFEQRWGVAARYELGTPAVGRSGQVVDDPLDPEWTGLRQRAGANLTFWPTEFSRLRLQGSVDLPSWRERPHWFLALNLEFSIGAHGAHPF